MSISIYRERHRLGKKMYRLASSILEPNTHTIKDLEQKLLDMQANDGKLSKKHMFLLEFIQNELLKK